jgi:glycosyltransferase involved in cell wall biosynthesis
MSRIGMITPRCHPEIGGIESHVSEVAARLAARGYDLEVLTTDRSGELPRVERTGGYVIRRFRAYPAKRDWYFSPGLFLAALRSRYDVVHVQGIHTLVPPMAMVAAILRRTPFILTFHTGGSSSTFRERARGMQFRLLSPLLRRARTLIGVSEYEARRFEDIMALPEGSITVIRNGGSLPALRVAVTPDRARVVTVGRLERYKGHHKVIEALPHLLKTQPDASVQVLGSGPYEPELHALASELGVEDRVSIRFVPPPDRALMGEIIAAAGVMCLLSDYEAHPVAVMEALAAGRPAVVSRTSGLTELADLGWVVGVEPDATAEETARAIERQIEDPVLPEPAELPTWETCVTDVADTYDSIIASRRGSRTVPQAR